MAIESSAPPPQPASLRHFAWLYAPPPQRGALAALFSMEDEIRVSASTELHHEVAHLRLQWWQAETARLANGEGVHPLSRELQLAAQAQHSRWPDLRPWVSAAQSTLARATFQSGEHWRNHCGLWADSVWRCAAQLQAAAAAGEAVSEVFISGAGAAVREIELLLSLASDARHGNINLPLEELSAAGLTTADCYRQPWVEPLATRIDARLGAARSNLRQCAAALTPQTWPSLRGLAAWIALSDAAAQRAQHGLPLALPANSATSRSTVGANFRAWHAARRAQARRGPLP